LKWKEIMTGKKSLFLSFLLILTLAGCNTQSAKNKSADDTERIKQESRDAAVRIQEGARQAGKDVKAMAQGAKEGWNEDKNALDLNTATPSQLTALGLSQKQAALVIQNRPYKSRDELVSKGVLSQQEYKDIETKVTVK
jgi:DNA uptake protein ComE-like DNA-binding protein